MNPVPLKGDLDRVFHFEIEEFFNNECDDLCYQQQCYYLASVASHFLYYLFFIEHQLPQALTCG